VERQQTKIKQLKLDVLDPCVNVCECVYVSSLLPHLAVAVGLKQSMLQNPT